MKRHGRIPLDLFLRRRRRRRVAAGGGAVLLLVLLVLLDQRGNLLGSDWHRYEKQAFRVLRVVDGDTLVLDVPDGERPNAAPHGHGGLRSVTDNADGGRAYTRVRLWGVDTPELARPHEGRPAEPLAERAREFVTRLCEGRTVRLTLEPHRVRDRYGRILAFVELPDGTMLNERIIAAGLSEADARWSHRHVQRFELLQQQAKFDRTGMWAR